nr:aldo/keto reductase [uncultured Mucilaginibacter sp.]
MTNILNRSTPNLPKIVFGTSSLGNLFVALNDTVKRDIVAECVKHSPGKVVFDSAGKYGAGLALESLGRALSDLEVNPDNVVISNKLGWFRTELKTPEPTFEKGVWVGIKHDAVQMISYDGMMKCFEQGNELLGGWISEMVSVHDPDEYLAAATSPKEEAKRYNDILEAYKALADLKASGRAKSVGIGAKDWKTIVRIAKDVKLDWIMVANSMTIKSHPAELLEFMADMKRKGIPIINSAVFHSGYLIGGTHYDYKLVDENFPGHNELLKWREDFFATCKEFNITPAAACVAYALKVPGVESVALSTTNPLRVKDNINMAHTVIPKGFWAKMVERGLLDFSFN